MLGHNGANMSDLTPRNWVQWVGCFTFVIGSDHHSSISCSILPTEKLAPSEDWIAVKCYTVFCKCSGSNLMVSVRFSTSASCSWTSSSLIRFALVLSQASSDGRISLPSVSAFLRAPLHASTWDLSSLYHSCGFVCDGIKECVFDYDKLIDYKVMPHLCHQKLWIQYVWPTQIPQQKLWITE